MVTYSSVSGLLSLPYSGHGMIIKHRIITESVFEILPLVSPEVSDGSLELSFPDIG